MAATSGSEVSKLGYDVTPMTAEQLSEAAKQLSTKEESIVRGMALASEGANQRTHETPATLTRSW